MAATILSNVLSCLWKQVHKDVKTVVFLSQAVTQMNKDVKNLDNKIHEIKVELDQAQQSPKRTVKDWLEEAEELKERSQSIGTEYETHQQHENYIGCCPKCLCRYRISKAIIDWNRTVSELQSQYGDLGQYGDPAPRTQISIQTHKFFGNGIQVAQSELERWLTEDTSVRLIGVFGMGGVGKTSLLRTINNSHKVCQSFELIIWVTVSKDHDILNLQNVIAKRLNLDLPEVIDKSNLEERNHVLCSYLKDKRYLLILDDMWETLDLESLGVSTRNEVVCTQIPASKIVLSTRSEVVCNQMRVDKKTSVKPLSEEEGWQLFSSRAFQKGNVPQEMKAVARKIAGECKGLPLAINVIAAAMLTYSDQHEWEHALQQLQNLEEIFYDFRDEIKTNLFQRLELSYNVLPDYLKPCFVYFAAYPEDREIQVEEVIDTWVAEGLVTGNEESYLPDTAHRFINQLRDRCLIEVAENDDAGRILRVKIHDVLRDMAIRIAEDQHRCYFKAGQSVSGFPDKEVNGKACERMSLVDNHLDSLPATFACSSLEVLLLGGNDGIKFVPKNFLCELSSLKVLDLGRTGITSLPPCIVKLKHLASLQLYDCRHLSELPETIGDLKQLLFLNVRFCEQLRFLPESISELESLRALDISHCKSLSHLPRGISKLVTLERLRMWGSSVELDFEEEANAEERKYGCLKDLQSLRRLRVLHVQIKVLHVQIKSPVKEGVMGNWSKMRDLVLDCNANQDYLPQDMQEMKDLESFTLRWCDVERLPRWVSDFRKLAYLQLYNSRQLKELPAELPCLRKELPAELPCLRVLKIDGCHKLEELDLGMGFPKLERLSLRWLESLECVGAVAAASGSGGLGEGASPLPPMLKSLEVYYCPKLKRFRGGWEDKLKCLEVIEVYPRQSWDAIQWEDPNMKASLESKFRRLF